MLSVTFKPEKLIRSLQAKEKIFSKRMQQAVRNTAKIFLQKVIERTPAPPTPPGQIYQRTGRLVAGWGPAAAFLGIGRIPSGEGSFSYSVSDSQIRFVARNEVEYAMKVEKLGPWTVPPGRPGGPQFRGGVFMVERSQAEMPILFELNIREAWVGVV